MTIKEKVSEKEQSIKELMAQVRTQLNNNSIEFNKNPQDWTYLTALSTTETKLKELIDYYQEINKIND